MALLFAALQAIAAMWLRSRLDRSIEHEYKRRLQDYQRELEIRDRAMIIAKLFAEWTAAPYDPKRLNERTWEASLWLPPEIVKALGARLTQAANAPNLKDILVQVRKQLRRPADNVTVEDIVHFQAPQG